MKFSILLLIFFDSSFASPFLTNFFNVIHNIGKCSPYDENEAGHGIIVRPETPFYLIKYPGKNIKPLHYLGIFEVSSSYDFYNKAKILPDGLILSILVTVDSNLYKTHGDNVINHFLSYWNNVNKIFEELNNPKVKIILQGIAVGTEPGVFDLSNITKEDYPRTYFPTATIDIMEEWWKDNYDRFEDLPDIDLFIHHTSSPPVDNNGFNYKNLTGLIKPFDCKHSSFEDDITVGIVLDTGSSEVTAARLIAQGFGVKSDETLGCKGNFIMTPSIIHKDSAPRPQWSECSKNSFEQIFKNESYSCFIMTKDHFFYAEYDD